MKKLIIVLLCMASFASAQKMYEKTSINPLTPFSLGTSLVPTFLNSYTITGTVTANATTFVCATGCASLRVGQGVTGSDGVNLLFPSKGGQLGTLITSVGTGINGATITISYASNASLTPGTYTITVGKNRWDTTSTALVNTLGANSIFSGQATLGNSTWAQQYLSGDCDDGTKVNNCFLMKSGATVNNFWGARSSDAAGSPEANISLYVNDNLSVAMGGWNHYWETILLPGAGVGKETHALESTVYNFSSSTQKLDPFNFNVGGTLENLRLTSGQANVTDLGTMYHASDAISILPINSIGYETAILIGDGALDEATVTHPPALALPSGAHGYGVTWYRATGYTTPAWNLYATNTTQNGNTLSLNDANATVAIVNASGTGSVFIESGALAMSGTHEAVFSGTGNNAGLDVASATINDPTSSGAVTLAAISHFGTPTLTSTSATTIATAATLTVDACPVASTNVTITTCQALRVLAGNSVFSGGINSSAIGATSASTGAFTTLSATGAITSTLATGTAPFTVASTTAVANLNASLLNGTTFAAPAAIGSGTPAAGNFTTLGSSGLFSPTLGVTATGAAISLNDSSNFNTTINTGTSTGTVTIGQNTATPSAIVLKGPVSFQAGTAFSGASWTTTSPVWNGVAMTLNDTTASGTVTTEAAYSLQAPTFTSTGGASTTITNPVTLWLAAPVCSGGVVCTNNVSLFAAGKVTLQNGITVTANTINLNANSNAAVNICTGTCNSTVSIGGASTTLVTSAAPFTNSNAAFKLTGITTGTNADTVCMKSDGTLLIQAAACTISSLRFKTDVTDVQGSAIPEIANMRVAYFRMKDGAANRDPNAASKQVGLIAENIAKVAPECAIYEPDMKTPKSYRQECVIALLVKAFQDEHRQNALLRGRLTKLETRYVR